ncbi:MAG: hypothetical protein B7X04_00585 [Parcubacteria group bacterium 21-54-25]|nr:MAG: hypothetical protein B7X04_00585 [Parcubacteria group bacterium 21-54-25]HQU07449.1 methionine biosynthesis protein MetW [Candidatus Paceibacterota bacterium]
MKKFLAVLKGDLGRLFIYPSLQVPEDFSIDYDRYWKVRGRSSMSEKGETLSLWQQDRASRAAEFIERNSTVLDLGSGGGAVLEYLREKRNIKPIAVDVSAHALISLRIKGIEALELDIASENDVEKLPEVDYILGFEILEHLPNPEKLIHTLAKKAKKGLIFSFPNTGYYAHRLRLLFGRFPLQWVVHPGEHLRFWTMADVRSWTPQLHLGPKSMVAYQGLPGLNRVWPALFGAGILLVLDTTDNENQRHHSDI